MWSPAYTNQYLLLSLRNNSQLNTIVSIHNSAARQHNEIMGCCAGYSNCTTSKLCKRSHSKYSDHCSWWINIIYFTLYESVTSTMFSRLLAATDAMMFTDGRLQSRQTINTSALSKRSSIAQCLDTLVKCKTHYMIIFLADSTHAWPARLKSHYKTISLCN